MEENHVKFVYDQIAYHFSDTRFCVWNMVKDFLAGKENLKGLDIGCGNGKNMLFPDKMFGLENCEKFVQICRKKKLNVVLGDCCDLPFKDNSFDYTICIAVFHHLESAERRRKAIQEMKRVVKPGGECLVSVWSFENQEPKRNFTIGDNLVPWLRSSDKKLFNRYYHIFTKEMIMSYIEKIKKIYNERGNWVVIF